MWSIALIVMVAVSSSLAMLVTGVTLVYTFERRRYRKFVQRHMAGVAFGASDLPAADDVKQTSTILRIKPQTYRPALKKLSGTWATISSPDLVEQKVVSGSPPYPLKIEPSLERERTLRKTLRGPIKKKLRRDRRSKRTVASQFTTGSPLSIITESNNSCQSLAELSRFNEASMVYSESRRSCESPTPISHSQPVAKTRGANASVGRSSTRDSLTKMSCIDRGAVPLRSALLLRSSSSASTASSAPEEPLPPLPLIAHEKPGSKSGLRAHVSSVSTDSVSSSVLVTPRSARRAPDGVVDKAQLQGLLELGLGLDHERIVRMNSPAKLMPRGRSDPRTATVTSLRASVDPCLDGPPPKSEDCSEQSEITKLPTQPLVSFAARPAMSRSMLEQRRDVDSQTTTLMSGALKSGDEPFMIEFIPRPKSVEVKALIKELKHHTQPQRNSSCSLGINKGNHKRQNCVRMSNLPFLPIPRKTAFPNIANNDEEVLLESNAPRHSKQCVTSLGVEKAGDSASFKPSRLPDPPQSIIFEQAVLSTTELTQGARWQYNVISPNHARLSNLLMQTPLQSPSDTPASLQFEDSPVLPSPAYTVSKLRRPPPRLSQVRGPRNPQSRDRRNSETSLKSYYASKFSSSSSPFKKSAVSGEHRKSAKMSRDAYPEDWPLRPNEPSTEACYRGLGDGANTNTDTGPGIDMVVDSVGVGEEVTAPNPAARTLAPPSTPIPLWQKQANQLRPLQPEQKMSSSASRSSVGGTSIWEDASVHEEEDRDASPSKTDPHSPRPDMPTPTKRNRMLAQLNGGHNNNNHPSRSPTSSLRTSQAKFDDYETYEKVIDSYREQSEPVEMQRSLDVFVRADLNSRSHSRTGGEERPKLGSKPVPVLSRMQVTNTPWGGYDGHGL